MFRYSKKSQLTPLITNYSKKRNRMQRIKPSNGINKDKYLTNGNDYTKNSCIDNGNGKQMKNLYICNEIIPMHNGIRHNKRAKHFEHSTTTQITTLPGGKKRNKYNIKDDMYFKKPFNQSRLYKMIHDFNYNLTYDKNYEPITQGYNVNIFPTKQRFNGSYKRGIKDNQIFF